MSFIGTLAFYNVNLKAEKGGIIMMMAPAQYAEQFENASYQEILKVKNELIPEISKFEHDYNREDPDWYVCPKPDVRYQWNLEVLVLIAPMLAEAFNREYEVGNKTVSDYAEDMRKFYGEK